MTDSAETQIVRGFLPVLGVLGSVLATYVYVVRAPDPLGRMTGPGAALIALPMFAAWLLRLVLTPRAQR